MQKLDGKSKDILKENIEKLKDIFPDIVTEGDIDFDKLKTTLGDYVDDSEERYNFTWNGKSKAKRLAQTPSTGTLRPRKEESVNWDTTENLFIEGDNLEVLKLLQKTYHKKVKMIYIDPPYNTGNDFIYKDNFKDNIKNYLELTGQADSEGKKLSANPETSGRYHTDWLNMMYPRLKLARNLLRDEGIIFISIDDNEVDNLKKICNEIFGEENFVEKFSWKKTETPANLAKKTKKAIEYILCYQKSDNGGSFEGLSKESKASNGLMNQTNSVHELIFPAGKIDTGIEDCVIHSGKYGTANYEIDLLESTKVESGVFVKPVRLRGKFKWGQSNLDEEIKNGTKVSIRTKSFSPSYEREEYAPEKPWNIIDKSFGVGTNENASSAMDGLMEVKNIMDYPKPVSLMKYLFRFLPENHKSDYRTTILDFFAGSCSTAQAILDLNAENQGNRKFIMVQLPEKTDDDSEASKAGYKTIADIGKERIRRVIKKIKSEQNNKSKKDKGTLFENKTEKNIKLDMGFKVFKLDSSNIKTWDSDFGSLEKSLLDTVDNIKKDRSAEDVLYEILLKYGLDLTLPIEERKICKKTVYSIGLGALIVCLDKDISLDVVEEIAKLKEELNPEVSRVVFSDAGFKDDVVKTNTIQILKQHGIND
ncbi:MAG: site-specific DNA-methyltransferase, partial [Candidatus Zapsychrus exili]|nr:site-specific DNA-methyltransferase [Candidatus Zapsychrus exili]